MYASPRDGRDAGDSEFISLELARVRQASAGADLGSPRISASCPGLTWSATDSLESRQLTQPRSETGIRRVGIPPEG